MRYFLLDPDFAILAYDVGSKDFGVAVATVSNTSGWHFLTVVLAISLIVQLGLQSNHKVLGLTSK